MSRLRPVVGCIAATLLAGVPCGDASAAPGREAQVFGPAGGSDFYGHVQSMADLKFAGVVKQQYDFSCGSAALATLLQFYGDHRGEAATFHGMWAGGDHAQIQKLGFSLLDMKRYLATRGLTANGYKVSLGQVQAAGLPGIALVTVRAYRHFVVIQGVRDAEVLIGDPALGLRVEPRASFEKSWNGVFFAIDDKPDIAKNGFNRAYNWAAYNRAPVGAHLTDPLSLQALTLTAPFYRDF